MIFDTEAVNNGRQPELDVARAIACVLMVLCHVGLYTGFGGSELMHTISEVLGAEFAAPVFMALMGIGICYSGHNEPKKMAVRGVKLIFLGYLLGFVRQGIPILLFGQMDPFFHWREVFEVDILQFAGLAMIAVALFRKLKLPSVVILMLSVIFLGIGECLSNVGTGITAADLALDLFWGVNEQASFPFLHWFFYVAFGLVFGGLLQHCTDKEKLYRTLLPVSFMGVVFVYVLLAIYDVEYYHASNYYWMGVKNAVFAVYYILLLFSGAWYISKKLNERVKKVCANLSRHLNSIYCISWVIIYILAVVQIRADFLFNDIVTYILMIVVTVLSYYIALWYAGAKKKYLMNKGEKR